MLATGEAIRSTGEAIAPRVNMLDEALIRRTMGGCGLTYLYTLWAHPL